MRITIQDLVLNGVKYAEEKGVSGLDLTMIQNLAKGIFQISDVDWIEKKRQVIEHQGDLLAFGKGMDRLIDGEPLDYVLGEVWFRGRQYNVDASVLIPRPETELLVEACIERLKTISEPQNWLNLECGAGSGVISIELALAFPDLYFSAWEISESSAELCKSNIIRHELFNLNLYQGDFFVGAVNYLQSRPGQPVFMVSNPPYIQSKVVPTLDASVKDFEPKQALDGGTDGLDYYRALFALFRDRKGILACEFGYDQRSALEALCAQQALSSVSFHKDFNGHDRYFIAERL